MNNRKAQIVSDCCKSAAQGNDCGGMIAQHSQKTLHRVDRKRVDTDCDKRKCRELSCSFKRMYLYYLRNDCALNKGKERNMSTAEGFGMNGAANLNLENICRRRQNFMCRKDWRGGR